MAAWFFPLVRSRQRGGSLVELPALGSDRHGDGLGLHLAVNPLHRADAAPDLLGDRLDPDLLPAQLADAGLDLAGGICCVEA